MATTLRRSAPALMPRGPGVSFVPVCAGVSLPAFVSFPNPSFVSQTDSSRVPCGILSVVRHPRVALIGLNVGGGSSHHGHPMPLSSVLVCSNEKPTPNRWAGCSLKWRGRPKLEVESGSLRGAQRSSCRNQKPLPLIREGPAGKKRGRRGSNPQPTARQAATLTN